MGMVANKIEVMLLTEKGEKIHWELWLDNEISTELTNDEHLFDSASTVEEFAGSIGKGFKDAYPFDDDDYEPDPNFIKQYCDDFGGSNPYDDEDDDFTKLKKLIKKRARKASCKTVFKKVVLVSNNQCEGYREYAYNVFDLENNTFERGVKKASLGSDYYDPDDCKPKSKDFMESLL